MSRSVSVRVSTYVDVDLDEIDTDDLVEELKSRGREELQTIDHDSRLTEIFYAFKFGKEDEAIRLSRNYVADALGKIL
jgi:regulator of sirC expression with transglutaminase-like and TPR domain